MVAFIIILAMAMVVGPILWIRPSPKERRIAAFRSIAMGRGVKVEPISLISNTYYKRVSERNLHVADYQWVRYRRIAKKGEVGPSIKGQWTQRKDRSGQLLWEPDPVTLKESEQVTALLSDWRERQDIRFLALELGPRTVSIVWTEQGDEQDVTQIIATLETLGNI